MKTKSLDAYFVQETWLEGDVFNEVINGYYIFRHNGGKGNHNFHGVAIILSLQYYAGWKDAGARPLMTTAQWLKRRDFERDSYKMALKIMPAEKFLLNVQPESCQAIGEKSCTNSTRCTRSIYRTKERFLPLVR